MQTRKPDARIEKVTLYGPRPFGGSATYPLTSDHYRDVVERLKAVGWTEQRRWTVPVDEQGNPITMLVGGTSPGRIAAVHCPVCGALHGADTDPDGLDRCGDHDEHHADA